MNFRKIFIKHNIINLSSQYFFIQNCHDVKDSMSRGQATNCKAEYFSIIIAFMCYKGASYIYNYLSSGVFSNSLLKHHVCISYH